MRYLNICFLLSCISLFFFTSCKDPHEYRVDSAFADYLLRFETEAALRGRTFDLASNGLIIEFATLKDNTAGLTHYEHPIRIEIDKTYWNAIAGSAGADEMKEDLIFHELGHGLLNRKHLNTTLENGDWKSIMCGGTKVNNRSWNINYRGIRRAYYINELFDEATPQPEFSANLLAVDTTGYFTKSKLTFEDISTAGWKEVDDTKHKISLESGRLRFESKVSDVYLVFAKTAIDVQSNFSFELNLEYSTIDQTGQYGVLFGSVLEGSTGATDPIEYFSINKNKKMFMGNRSWYSFFTELDKEQLYSTGNNKLKVFKVGSYIYYFINGVYAYCSEMETKVPGFYFGFMVPPNGVVMIDNFAIAQTKVSGVAMNVKSNKLLEFECVAVKSLNQGLVRK